jgi:hypothetical protein
MAAIDDANSTLQNVVRQIGLYAQSIANAYPAATTTASPRAIGFNSITTTAALVLSNSTMRHGLVFHNPGTANLYVFPTAITTSPTTAAVGGAFIIYPGGTLPFSPASFPNVNCSWSAFSATGSSQALTIVEFY